MTNPLERTLTPPDPVIPIPILEDEQGLSSDVVSREGLAVSEVDTPNSDRLARLEVLRASFYATGDRPFIVYDPRQAAYDLRYALNRLKALEEALRPFAAFRLDGFEGEVLEVVPSSPDNPARRIEPIWTGHFRRARLALNGGT